jgi:hypothetical protein
LFCAFVLSVVPSLARADEPSPAARVQHRVEDGLLKPLAEQEAKTSPFSRMRPIPHERRVRVTQAAEAHDKAGRAFMTFAVDIKYAGQDWRENDIVGCAYTTSGDLFVKRGDAYRPAAFLLGQNADAVPGVCEASPPPKA